MPALWAGPAVCGYLKVADKCDRCGLAFGFSDAGDGAAWFVMLIAGTLATAGVLFVELTWQPAYWVHALWPSRWLSACPCCCCVRSKAICSRVNMRPAPAKGVRTINELTDDAF
jgi:uncharacterized protein (DUF983 family)